MSFVLVAACAISPGLVKAQTQRATTAAIVIDARQLERLVDSVMAVGMAVEHITGAAFVLVRDGRIVVAKGYGFADRETSRRVVPDSTVWPFASITKVLTATAVVQLADRGRIDLGADVNRYLRKLKVPATYPQPVTTGHLLAHTAGFDELRGRLVESATEIKPLGEFLRGKLIRIRQPGTMTSYSSFGMALAGLVVEEVSGLSFDEYMRCNIFVPLGMRSARIMSRPGDERGLATGYEYADSVVRRVPYEWYHSTPASSFAATATDMAAFMIAHLEGGAFNGKRILSERATRDMQAQHATMHPLVPGWGYGWQLRDSNGQRILEHGGDIGGFSSILTLLPDARTGFLVVGHREGADLRFTVRQAVLDRYFPDRRTIVTPKPDSANTARLGRFAGTYRANVYCHTCPDSLRFTQDFPVTANPDGTLSAFDGRWVEVSPLFFRSTAGSRRFGLAADSSGRITALTIGSWQVLEKIQTASDSAGIRDAALDYIEGWYAGDATRMERALHPELAKRIVRTDSISSVSRISQMSALSLVHGTRNGGGNRTPSERQRRDVSILDIYRGAASAKIVASDWIDYLHLARWNGRWVIVNVLWELRPPGGPTP